MDYVKKHTFTAFGWYRIGLGLLLSSRLCERGRRSQNGKGAERGRAGEECSPAQSDCMLAHV